MQSVNIRDAEMPAARSNQPAMPPAILGRECGTAEIAAVEHGISASLCGASDIAGTWFDHHLLHRHAGPATLG